LFVPANVRAAIVPRWGVPFYFRPQDRGAGAAGVAILPLLTGQPADARLDRRLNLVALLEEGEGARLALRNGGVGPSQPLDEPRLLGFDDDLAWRPASSDSAAPSQERPAPPGQGHLRAARGVLTPSSSLAAEGRTWFLSIAGQLRPGTALVDLYGWTDALAAAWKPVAGGPIATLMAARRPGSRTEWIGGAGRVLSETIRHNRLDLMVEVTSPGGVVVSPGGQVTLPGGEATLIVGDAWWPGWQARLENGQAVTMMPYGPWRAARLTTVGRHVLTMTYVPDGLPLALVLSLAGLAGALLARRKIGRS
jgi:hypothetical protein